MRNLSWRNGPLDLYTLLLFAFTLIELTLLGYATSAKQTVLASSQHSSTIPKYWDVIGIYPHNYEYGVSGEIFYQQKKCAFVRARNATSGDIGAIRQRFKADRYRNKRMRFTAVVKSEDIAWAGLWMRVFGPGWLVLREDETRKRQPITGTTEWQRYDVVLDVPESSMLIAIGVKLGDGKGQIWVTNVRFEETEDEVTADFLYNYAEELRNLDFSED